MSKVIELILRCLLEPPGNGEYKGCVQEGEGGVTYQSAVAGPA